MRTRTLLALALLAVVPLPLFAGEDEEMRRESASYPTEGARSVTVDLPIGELRVVGTTDGTVDAQLRVTCRRDTQRCRDKASRVHLRPRRSGSTLELEVVGLDQGRHGADPTPHLELRLPASIALAIEVGVGEVDVRGVSGDVAIETGVGEVNVRMAESAVREVALDVGVGDARLVPETHDVRTSGFFFLGNEVDWREGAGTSEVTVEVGVGEATVRLEP
jgi:hypothetical protein